ncbi:hypothetical protein D0Z67_15695 [Streptomyces seoulensis]|uniref:Uncharacterized protein n=1 Tax=Streptomyces seoulensis TaxID=73044 RepID=A0A4P6U0T4_STRSO|nr:hypothetical protein D0Z67_15695 [Streptomyces seoulensis]
MGAGESVGVGDCGSEGVADGGSVRSVGEGVVASGVGVDFVGVGDCFGGARGEVGVVETGAGSWGRGSREREWGCAEAGAEGDGFSVFGVALCEAGVPERRGAAGDLALVCDGVLDDVGRSVGDAVGTGRPAVASGPVPPIGCSPWAAVGRVRSAGWWFRAAARVRPPPTSATAVAHAALRRVFRQRDCSRRRAARPLPEGTSAGRCGAAGGGTDLPRRDEGAGTSSSPGRRTAYGLVRTGIGARSGEAQTPQPGQTRAPFRCRRQAEQ